MIYRSRPHVTHINMGPRYEVGQAKWFVWNRLLHIIHIHHLFIELERQPKGVLLCTRVSSARASGVSFA